MFTHERRGCICKPASTCTNNSLNLNIDKYERNKIFIFCFEEYSVLNVKVYVGWGGVNLTVESKDFSDKQASLNWPSRVFTLTEGWKVKTPSAKYWITNTQHLAKIGNEGM